MNTAYGLIIAFTDGKQQSIKNMCNMQIHFIIIKDDKDKIICTKLRMFPEIHKCKVVGRLY